MAVIPAYFKPDSSFVEIDSPPIKTVDKIREWQSAKGYAKLYKIFQYSYNLLVAFYSEFIKLIFLLYKIDQL